MGLFDLLKTNGALSAAQQSTAPPPQYIVNGNNVSLNPAYTQYVADQANPRNMDTGRKIMLLGQALQGENVGGDIDEYSQGIRDRFQARQDNQTRAMNNAATLAQAQQTYNQAEQMNPLLVQSQRDANTGQQLRNTGQGLQNTSTGIANNFNLQNNPLLLESNALANTAARLNNDFNAANNPALLRSQQLANSGATIANQGNQFANQQARAQGPLRTEALRLANEAAGIQNDANQEARFRNMTGQAQWIGDANTGFVGRVDPQTGLIEDVTAQHTPSMIAGFKAQAGVINKPKNFNNALGRSLTPAELQIDKEYAKTSAKFRAQNVAANAATLEFLADELLAQGDVGDTGLSLSQPFKSAARLIDPEGDAGIRAIVDADSLDIQETVAGVIQQNLRETLGAQFTQREGFLLIQRAYNSRLSPAVNARRLRAAAELAKAYLKAQEAKSDYYRTNGTLAGYDQDFDGILTQAEGRLREIYAQTEQGVAPAPGTAAAGGSPISPEAQAAMAEVLGTSASAAPAAPAATPSSSADDLNARTAEMQARVQALLGDTSLSP